MKKSIRLCLIVPIVALLTVVVSYLSFKIVEQLIIEENKNVAHRMAQNLLPVLLTGDAQEVDRLLKTLEIYPGVHAAELISGTGISLASYVRDGVAVDPMQAQFALASVDETLGVYGLHVTAPLTFDTQILANLHIAINLWPAYLRVIQWFGLLFILPVGLYVVVKQMRLKIEFEKSLDSEFRSGSSFSINRALQDALEEFAIFLEYQPIYRLDDKGIFGAEVVVCWRHPSGETLHVSPADFVALAEQSGVFLPFDTWILESACKQFSIWHRQHGPLVLALNIASSQLKDRGFYQKVRDACITADFPHQLIEFEINETDLLRSSTALADVEVFVQQDMSMSLTIDGFGLSPRSPELLQSLLIHKVKFASQLIENVEHDMEMFQYLQSFGCLTPAHDVQMMADGLVSETQTSTMQKLGCMLGQGPYFSQALSPSQFEGLLNREACCGQKNQPQDVSGAVLIY